MTPRTSRLGRNPVVFWSFALLVGLSGTVAKADPLYTVTNLGSSGVTLMTASGSTIGVVSNGFGLLPTSGGNIPDLALTQLASVSNGQVSYSFATTPDVNLQQGQGPLSGFPVSPQSLGISSSVYGSASVSGLLDANGYAALVLNAPLLSFPPLGYSIAYGVQESSAGTFGQPSTITTTPDSSYENNGTITIAGVNSLNQALIGTAFSNVDYASLVYNLGTHTLTDLGQLPQFSGSFSDMWALAIDNKGQILVTAVNAKTMQEETLLLTPSGEAIVTAPEPSTCIGWVLVVGASWFAAKRAGRKRA
jgi:hypothetical protein